MSDFIERNEKLLSQIRDGTVPKNEVKTAIGSFIICIFDDENMPKQIPLFFSFISSQTGKDYTEEVNLVEECYNKGMKDYGEYIITKLFGIAMSD